jgi:glycosyltransferase
MISIVTITYNNFDELIETLNSIPELPMVESIVINGGQCEKTKEYLKIYSGKSITEKDEGIGDAFNKGVKLSSGKYIMFLNSGDVLIDKYFPEKALKIIEENSNISFVHSNLLLVDDSNLELFMRPKLSNLGRGMPYLHPTMIVKKELFNKIGMFDTKLKISMDFDWIVKLVKNNFLGYYLNNNAVVKMDASGKSIKEENEAIKECFWILKSNSYLTPTNLFGFTQRYMLYVLRMVMVKIGLKELLISMKKIKHLK